MALEQEFTKKELEKRAAEKHDLFGMYIIEYKKIYIDGYCNEN